MSNKITIEDFSPIGGIYSDFIYMKNHELVSIIKVQGINMDMLSTHDQNELFDEYGTFIAQNSHYEFQTNSRTVPIKLDDYVKQWKTTHIRDSKDISANEELKQLRASYLIEYQKVESSLKMAKKEHFIVISEKIKQPTIEYLKEAERVLRSKRDEIKQSITGVMEKYTGNIVILSSYEAKKLLHQYLDYEMSMFD